MQQKGFYYRDFKTDEISANRGNRITESYRIEKTKLLRALAKCSMKPIPFSSIDVCT
jgi:hypothetical protein